MLKIPSWLWVALYILSFLTTGDWEDRFWLVGLGDSFCLRICVSTWYKFSTGSNTCVFFWGDYFYTISARSIKSLGGGLSITLASMFSLSLTKSSDICAWNSVGYLSYTKVSLLTCGVIRFIGSWGTDVVWTKHWLLFRSVRERILIDLFELRLLRFPWLVPESIEVLEPHLLKVDPVITFFFKESNCYYWAFNYPLDDSLFLEVLNLWMCFSAANSPLDLSLVIPLPDVDSLPLAVLNPLRPWASFKTFWYLCWRAFLVEITDFVTDSEVDVLSISYLNDLVDG